MDTDPTDTAMTASDTHQIMQRMVPADARTQWVKRKGKWQVWRGRS